ncbi:MAG: hypothetical protein WC518_01350 [Patescibacteria group bacterium]
MKNQLIKKIIFPLFLIFIFIVAIGIWSTPILFKGYPVSLRSVEIVLARNLAQSSVYGSENDLNVVVAPELVKTEAHYSSQGNKFSPIFWSMIFKALGHQDWNHLIIISLIINALSLIFFTLTIRFLFGMKTAMFFPFIYILLPSIWQTAAVSLGVYEFSLLFFSLFTLFYFWGGKQKFSYFYLVLSGIFMIFSCLAKEVMFLFVPVFFFWLLFYKKKKELLAVFIPFFVLLAIFWLPTMLGFKGQNHYRNFFVVNSAQEDSYADYHSFGEFCRDPYTFHFEREATKIKFEQKIKQTENEGGWLYLGALAKTGANNAIRNISFSERLSEGMVLLLKHLLRYLSLEDIGGPFIFLLMIIGWWQLKKKDVKLHYLLGVWLVAVPFLLAFVALASRNHLVDFGFAIAGLVSLGLIGIWQTTKDSYSSGKYAKIFFILVILLTLYALFLAGRTFWGRAYDSSNTLEIQYLAKKTNEIPNISPREVIAGGCACFQPTLNYLTNKSVVFFHPDTIRELVEKRKLQAAFDKFGVKYFIGYDSQISKLIAENSNAKNIAAWPEKKEVNLPTSYNKSWLLNLIR